jgi:hypothetical protein
LGDIELYLNKGSAVGVLIFIILNLLHIMQLKWIIMAVLILGCCTNMTIAQSRKVIEVKTIGNKKIVIDALGNKLIDENNTYSDIESNIPYDHFLWIKQNNKWAFFDLKGKALSPLNLIKCTPLI